MNINIKIFGDMYSFNVTFACSDYEHIQAQTFFLKTSGSSLRYFAASVLHSLITLDSVHATLTCGENE